MARIAVGGFQHETNVFAPLQGQLANFLRRDGWPPLCVGKQMLQEVQGVNLAITGAIKRLRVLGHEIVPLLWCSATPSAHVTQEAFEHITSMMLGELAKAEPVDGILLDLHGAMVSKHIPDGDGEVLRRVREAVGAHVPIVACLDLHANISDQMMQQASVLELYRTYPHVDMSATGERGVEHLDSLLQKGLARFPATALKRPGFVIPPHWGSTLMDPARSIYKHLTQLADDTHIECLALAFGFPYSDVYETGPAIVAYGFDQQRVDDVSDILLHEITHSENAFNGRLYKTDEAVQEAIRLSAHADGPIILADTQDNPGGGGPGDTVGILRALVEHNASDALVGVIIDAPFVAQAHAAGPGTAINASLGEKSGLPGHTPYTAKFRVLEVAGGPFRATGPMMAGADIDLGATALLETEGVQVTVGSNAIQTLDQSMFRHLGINPARKKIIALKSSVHFRNDFQDIATAILMVAAPGPVPADLSTLSFQHLRPGLRY